MILFISSVQKFKKFKKCKNVKTTYSDRFDGSRFGCDALSADDFALFHERRDHRSSFYGHRRSGFFRRSVGRRRHGRCVDIATHRARFSGHKRVRRCCGCSRHYLLQTARIVFNRFGFDNRWLLSETRFVREIYFHDTLILVVQGSQ